MDKFNWSRVGLLLRMEWVKNQKFFVAFWILVFVGIIIGTGYMRGTIGRYLITRPSNDFLMYFSQFGVIAWLIYASFSFKEFHKKESSIEFLSLPANQSEKFTSKLLIYVLLFPILYSIVFYFSINTSIYLWDNYTLSYVKMEDFYNINNPNAKPFNYLTFEGVYKSLTRENFWLIGLTLYSGVLLVTGCFSQLSSLSFGKFSLFLTVLFSLVYIGICAIVLVLSSHILLPEQTIGFDLAFQQDFRILDDIPISIVTLYATLLMSSAIFLTASFYKLKEKEV